MQRAAKKDSSCPLSRAGEKRGRPAPNRSRSWRESCRKGMRPILAGWAFVEGAIGDGLSGGY
ncbi:MAG: hypothetical protein MUP30_13595 [Deltaproteobacteria bacterium]|nr:hypothetical protein [Deltaproteobacteria bacterium]